MIAAAILAAAAAAALASAPRVTGWSEIPLHSGVNTVAHLLPDGRDGVIVRASPHAEVADQRRTVSMVLAAPAKNDAGDWSLVRFAGLDAAPTDLVSEAPHTGEDALSSLRVFRARVDGAPAVLAVRTRRDFVLPVPAASRAWVDVFQLRIDPDSGAEVFQRISHRRTRACYGHSDLGAAVEFGVPLPAGYAGPRAAARCGSD